MMNKPITVTIHTTIEVNVEVTAQVTEGYPAVYNPPDLAQPEEPPEVEIISVKLEQPLTECELLDIVRYDDRIENAVADAAAEAAEPDPDYAYEEARDRKAEEEWERKNAKR